MDWITGMQHAIDYIEQHLTQELDYEHIARECCSSSFHFQRLFSLVCGCTLGEYIRCRRLTLAGAELAAQRIRVIDAALKYGYDSPDSFARAFQKFHGVTPSQARSGAALRTYARLSIKISLEGGISMNYRIEEKPAMILPGYGQRFTGVPYGAEREKQEEHLFVTTRAKQWLLRGAAVDSENEYVVITNPDDDGYDFWYANKLDEWSREHLYDRNVTGVDFMEKFGFEDIAIPAQRYVVFSTDKCRHPVAAYVELREKIISEWLPNAGIEFVPGPELAMYHWPSSGDQRYIEIWMPVK